jgi:YjjG family noncanonical pyrimidine nucleotidase
LRKLKHIFFDLDHTLWDYDTSSMEALTELYNRFNLDQLFTSTEAFIKKFHFVNAGLWDRYNKDEIDREYIRKHRFASVVAGRMDPDEQLTNEMSDFFISFCPTLPYLMEGAVEVLENLKDDFGLSIISNGFTDTQSVKLSSCKIDHYFEHVITSESAGSRKPSTEIFDHALALASVAKEEVIMIGDNLNTDIAGAKAAGWEAIWYCQEKEEIRHNNPHKPVIYHLKEITELVSC